MEESVQEKRWSDPLLLMEEGRTSETRRLIRSYENLMSNGLKYGGKEFVLIDGDPAKLILSWTRDMPRQGRIVELSAICKTEVISGIDEYGFKRLYRITYGIRDEFVRAWNWGTKNNLPTPTTAFTACDWENPLQVESCEPFVVGHGKEMEISISTSERMGLDELVEELRRSDCDGFCWGTSLETAVEIYKRNKVEIYSHSYPYGDFEKKWESIPYNIRRDAAIGDLIGLITCLSQAVIRGVRIGSGEDMENENCEYSEVRGLLNYFDDREDLPFMSEC